MTQQPLWDDVHTTPKTLVEYNVKISIHPKVIGLWESKGLMTLFPVGCSRTDCNMLWNVCETDIRSALFCVCSILPLCPLSTRPAFSFSIGLVVTLAPQSVLEILDPEVVKDMYCPHTFFSSKWDLINCGWTHWASCSHMITLDPIKVGHCQFTVWTGTS